MRADAAWSYARELLERLTGTRPEPGTDGDLPAVVDGTPLHVRISVPHDAVVQITAVAVADVEATPDLLSELNRRNASGRFCRWWHDGEDVHVAVDVWGDDLTAANTRHACELIADEAGHGGGELAERFGGRTSARALASHAGAPGAGALGSTSGWAATEPSPYL